MFCVLEVERFRAGVDAVGGEDAGAPVPLAIVDC
jgi:hypothetical protein